MQTVRELEIAMSDEPALGFWVGMSSAVVVHRWRADGSGW
jgi:hypothetical protein